MDDPQADELIFSANFACPRCGYSIEELEPRLFSFNNPVGACPTCDGLGVEQFFDPERVVAHPHLSLAGGAVRGWDRRNAYYFQLITSLGKHFDFDVEATWETLPQKVQQHILFGSGKEVIKFSYFNDHGGSSKKSHPFEGVVRNMERRYRETESNAVREELSRYISTHACPKCGAPGSTKQPAMCLWRSTIFPPSPPCPSVGPTTFSNR